MIDFKLAPRLVSYPTWAEFASGFGLGPGDLLLTNEPIYKGGMGAFPGRVIFQEKFGLGEPTSAMMDALFAEARAEPYDRVIAVGGGTVIDMAKLLALGGTASTIELFTAAAAPAKARELVIVPTTCGTGSEVTNISILEIIELHTKKGLAHEALFADVAVLVPGLLGSIPYKVLATSSIDALIHATESFVAPRSNAVTELFGVSAIETIIAGYRRLAAEGKGVIPSLAEDFLLASCYAGIAFGNTGVGAVHAMSYPLGGSYHVPHGEANQQLFTTVFKAYERLAPKGRIEALEAILARALGVGVPGVWDALDELLEAVLPRKPLREYGMKEAEIESFADSVIANQQRLLKNCYAPLSRDEMMKIYRSLY